ncbi:MAG: hypothetical protein QOD77_571 [Thermoplasmata archaeon]|jgi:hypothetical protein|nr:hypothetical protein [Thermoplasmata archaeon]
MATFAAAVSRRIPATAERLWAILVDYRGGHARILPDAFEDLVVEEGGRGAGTVLRVTVKAGGRRLVLRMHVIEPVPGRVLEERLDDGTVTRFLLEPDDDGGCKVTIATVWPRKPGLKGWLESKGAPRFARKAYAQELANLEREAANA